MKILAVCQYYYPEPMRFTDMCEALVNKGHSITVITGVPNYPEGEIYPEYRKSKCREEIINGVRVIRCATVPRKKGTVMRFLNYFSFAISAWLKAGHIKEEYDVVLINQMSPIMMCWAGLRYAAKHNKKTVMYCMDLWPASLAAGGIEKESFVYKIFNKISKNIYVKADKILMSSRMFGQYFLNNFGIDSEKTEYLPQYADSQFENPLPFRESYKTVNLMFAGNIGAAQSIYTVLDAAKILNNSNIKWHIVGDGSERVKAEKYCTENSISNVSFYGRHPLNEMPQFYEKADAMIVTLTGDEFISMTLPGKVQTYMAAGKPIIAAANGETADIISKSDCGFCAPADSAELLAVAVTDFVNCTDKKALAKNSRLFYENNFTRAGFINRLEKVLEEYSDK